MKTKQEIVEFLKECVDENGTLDLSDIDTTSFAENVNISEMKVRGSLIQCFQQVKGVLISHKLKINEKWESHQGYVVRVKKGK